MDARKRSIDEPKVVRWHGLRASHVLGNEEEDNAILIQPYRERAEESSSKRCLVKLSLSLV